MTTVLDGPGLDAVVDPGAQLELLGDGFWFTEGPAWNPAEQSLVFSDIPGDRRHRWTEQRGVELIAAPTLKGNGMAYEADGSLLVCEQVSSQLVRLTPDGHRDLVAFHHDGRYLNSPNDVVVSARDGAIYFTDPNYGRWPGDFGCERACELGFQGVFRVPPGGGDCELVVDAGEFEQPNGLCFSPDERVMYVNDSPRTEIKAFDVAAGGRLVNGRVLIGGIGTGETGAGSPDGMECDELGNVWCSGGGGIWVVAPDGERLGIVRIPEVCGSLAWGGPDRRSLFVTASDKLYRLRTRVASAPLPMDGVVSP
jgi:gluconolactonase